MGSKSKKLRGVRAKFWADLEIFLNTAGPRVDSGKSQGLFRKIVSRNGIFDSSPLDRDLTVQI